MNYRWIRDNLVSLAGEVNTDLFIGFRRAQAIVGRPENVDFDIRDLLRKSNKLMNIKRN